MELYSKETQYLQWLTNGQWFKHEIMALGRDGTPLVFGTWGEEPEFIIGLDIDAYKGVYITLNEGTANPKRMTDSSCTLRTNLVLDFDSLKAAGHKDDPATDIEHELAIMQAQTCKEWLDKKLDSEAAVLDSGNGAALIYPIKWANGYEQAAAIQELYKDVKKVKTSLDLSTFNAARVYRVPGTMNRKGTASADRPFRVCKVLHLPETRKEISWEKFALLYPPPPKPVMAETKPFTGSGGINESMESFESYIFPLLEKSGIEVKWKQEKGSCIYYHLTMCPVLRTDCTHKMTHGNEYSIIFDTDTKKIGYNNFHDHGKDLDWKQVRKALDENYGFSEEEEQEFEKMTEETKQENNEDEFAKMTNEVMAHPDNIMGSFNPHIEDMTDRGNAEMFVKLHGEDLRKVREWRMWIKWNGVYWQPCSINHIIARFVHPMVKKHMVDLAKKIGDDDRRKKWFSHICKSNNSHAMEAIEKEAGRILEVEVKDLNRNPNLFATASAVIDLRTCKPVAIDREDYITIASRVKYEPEAKCPVFNQFMADILINADGSPSPQMVEYMQRSFGYCLTPNIAQQIFFILHGVGQNGKSTLMDALQFVLGEYAIQGADTLYFEGDRRANNEDEARLYQKRVCVTAETKDSNYFSGPKIKRLTGGDRITASFKYQTQFEFTPTHKLFLLCNHLPRFDAGDDAMTRRIKLVPFNFVVPAEKRDRNMVEKLRAEASGIFNWMLAGLKEMNTGKHLGDEFTPDIMKVVKNAYIAENDELMDFIEEWTCENADGAAATKAAVYEGYTIWAKGRGKIHPYNMATLGTKLEAKGWKELRLGKDRTRCWTGVKMKKSASGI